MKTRSELIQENKELTDRKEQVCSEILTN